MSKTITLVDTNGKETTIKAPLFGSAEIKSQQGLVCVETTSVTGSQKAHCVMTGTDPGRTSK